MMGGGPAPYEYALIRIVPRIDRGETMNAGILLYSRPLGFLRSCTYLDRDRLAALDPAADPAAIERALVAAASCDPTPGDDLGRRFRWLTAPRSTVVQPGPVHTGLTADPESDLERMFRLLVLPVTVQEPTAPAPLGERHRVGRQGLEP